MQEVCQFNFGLYSQILLYIIYYREIFPIKVGDIYTTPLIGEFFPKYSCR